eukprot:c20442_g1_i1 orf=41-1045(+)
MDLGFSVSLCNGNGLSLISAPHRCKAIRLGAPKCPPARFFTRRGASHALCKVPPRCKVEGGLEEEAVTIDDAAPCCLCCGRRHALGALAGALSASLNPSSFAHASSGNHDPKLLSEAFRPARPGWYEEFFATALDAGMKSYEMQMEGNKAQLFSSLDEKALDILELGIGTGPNIKYYAKRPGMSIVGVDPNGHMEKYCRAAASAAGLADSQFKFVNAVGEALPISSSSVDAVICTLVLCSVKDVAATLKEVKRVLRPAGSFFFIEHVAAPVGSSLRFWQDLLNPIEQLVADGCNLNRNTSDAIHDASFTVVKAQKINVPFISLISPHIIGMAQV